MLDKNLIKKNFKKSLSTYDENAFIQKKMAQKLVEEILIQQNKTTKQKPFFKNILEIGSYTGILTNKANENFDFESYLALDVVDCEKFVKKINSKIDFLQIDIEDFINSTDLRFDLIIANASLQWCFDFKFVCEKLKSLLKNEGILAISIFGTKNLIEIKDIFNIGLNYPELKTLTTIFENSKITQKQEKLNFKNSLDILKHLKSTGVNSILKNKLSYLEIKEKLSKLEEKYQTTLTYEPVFIIYQKN